MCLAQGPQRSDVGEAWTCGPSVSSQALYHWATAIPGGRCSGNIYNLIRETLFSILTYLLTIQGCNQRLYPKRRPPNKFGELRDIWPSCMYFTFQVVNNKGADQTAWMRRLVCAFVVRKQQNQGFSRRGPYDVEPKASWPPPGYAPVSCICKERLENLTVLIPF